MKTLKWLAMPLLALALTSTFSACSDNKDDEEEQGGGQSSGTLTPEETKSTLYQRLLNCLEKDYDGKVFELQERYRKH